jgi:hypothetical protein
MNALQAFYTATQARVAANPNGCGPTRITN